MTVKDNCSGVKTAINGRSAKWTGVAVSVIVVLASTFFAFGVGFQRLGGLEKATAKYESRLDKVEAAMVAIALDVREIKVRMP